MLPTPPDRWPFPAPATSVPPASGPWALPPAEPRGAGGDVLEVSFTRRSARRLGDPSDGLVTMAVVTGEIDSGNAAALEDALSWAVLGSATAVVDLGAARFYDSASVRTLLEVAERAARSGARVHVARPPSSLLLVHRLCWPERTLSVAVRTPGRASAGARRALVVPLGFAAGTAS